MWKEKKQKKILEHIKEIETFYERFQSLTEKKHDSFENCLKKYEVFHSDQENIDSLKVCKNLIQIIYEIYNK